MKKRGVAQLVARLVRDQEAGGSSPPTPTIMWRQKRCLLRKARLYRAFLLPKRRFFSVPKHRLSFISCIPVAGDAARKGVKATNKTLGVAGDIARLGDDVADISVGANHRTLHTADYYDKVNSALSGARDRDEAIDILHDIAEMLSNGSF